MFTANDGCVCATYKFTCSNTVLASLVMFFIHVDNRTTFTISLINPLMTSTLYQAIKEIKSPPHVLVVFLTVSEV